MKNMISFLTAFVIFSSPAFSQMVPAETKSDKSSPMKMEKKVLNPTERDLKRAELIREKLGG